jgi:hypothetical protein
MTPSIRDGAVSASQNRLHPGFLPYRPLRDELLGMACAQWVARCNELAVRRNLRSCSGAPLSFFVADGATGATNATNAPNATGALGYEASIYHEGRIACRTDERGALHDLHNAVTWLTFPLIKATLNRLHLTRAERAYGGRGRVRDAVTLLDENGLLWLSRSAELDRHLVARDWPALLIAHREQVREEVTPIILGHGLLEKLARPYKAMTAHCLICASAAAVAAPADIDAAVADAIDAAFESGVPPRLAPLPILGLPGWDPANEDRSYYDDARVFRG